MFTPIESGIGGLLIGLACSSALLVDGHIAGCSGVLGPWLRALLLGGAGGKWWNAIFMVGIMCGGIVNLVFNEAFAFPGALVLSPWIYVAAGFLIGGGTRIGKGCTSGHGLCGLARFSPRSLVAVMTFMSVAAVTVYFNNFKTRSTRHMAMEQFQWPQTSFSTVALCSGLAVVAVLGVLPQGMLKVSAPFLSGTLFGLGLGVSGMTDQSKVIGFLDVTGLWDPSLAFVMGCGLCVTVPAFAWARRQTKPRLENSEFEAPGPGCGTDPVEWKLVLGSAFFGVGWGLCGICPGPALAASVPNVIKSSPNGAGWCYASTLLTIAVGWLICDRALARWASKPPSSVSAPMLQ